LLEEFLKGKKIKSKRVMMSKSKGQLFAILKVKGTEKQFAQLNEELIKNKTIIEYY